jgi:hypothetical protein
MMKMETDDPLFGVEGIGELLEEEESELDVQKYLYRALAEHVEGTVEKFIKKRVKISEILTDRRAREILYRRARDPNWIPSALREI